MADGAFGLTRDLERATAPVWAKVKDHVTPLEWLLGLRHDLELFRPALVRQAQERRFRGGGRYGRTTTPVPCPMSLPTLMPCQPSGTGGSVHMKTMRASIGARFTQP